MEQTGLWIVRHHQMVGLALAAGAGLVAWQVFRIGVQAGTIRALLGEEAFAASEALGG